MIICDYLQLSTTIYYNLVLSTIICCSVHMFSIIYNYLLAFVNSMDNYLPPFISICECSYYLLICPIMYTYVTRTTITYKYLHSFNLFSNHYNYSSVFTIMLLVMIIYYCFWIEGPIVHTANFLLRQTSFLAIW